MAGRCGRVAKSENTQNQQSFSLGTRVYPSRTVWSLTLAVLLSAVSLWSRSAQIVLTDVRVTTAAGTPNALTASVSTCITTFTLAATGDKLTLATATNGHTKIFGEDGSVKTDTTLGYPGDFCSARVVHHPSGGIVSGYTENIPLYGDFAHLVARPLTCSGATCTFGANSDECINKVVVVVALPKYAPDCDVIVSLHSGHLATNYFFLIKRLNTGEFGVVRVDLPTPDVSPLGGGNFQYGVVGNWNSRCPSSKPATLVKTLSNLNAVVNCGDSLILFQASNLGHLAIAGTSQPQEFLIDNIDEGRMLLTPIASPFGLAIIETPTATIASVLLISQLTLVGEPTAGATNLGQHPFYLVPVRNPSSVDLLLVSKFTLEIYFTISLTTFSIGPSSLAASIQVSELGFVIAMASTAPGNNIMMYTVTMQLCNKRVGTDCTECPAGAYLLDPLPTDRCYYLRELPPKYGIDTTTLVPSQIAKVCNDPNCLECTTDYMICTKCDGSSHYYLRVSDKTCVPAATAAPRFGIDLTSSGLAACSDPNCLWCNLDHLKCIVCDTAYFVDNLQTCIAAASVPLGSGIDPTTSRLHPCPRGCSKCTNNCFACDECNMAGGFYLRPSTLSCVLVPSELAPKETPLPSGLLGTCTDPHCISCSTGPAQCVRCEQNLGYFLQSASSSACVLASTAAPGFGINHAAGYLEPCMGSGNSCLECPFGSQYCSKCNSGSGWYLNFDSGACAQKPQFPPGTGANNLLGVVSKCATDHCANCLDDFKVCATCEKGYLFNTVSGKCFTRDPISVKSTYFRKSSFSAVVIFDTEITKKQFRNMLKLDMFDDKGKPFSDFSQTGEISLDASGKTLSIPLGFNRSISSGKLVLTQLGGLPVFESSDNLFPKDLTISIDDISRLVVSETIPISPDTASQTVQSVGGSAKLLLMVSSPGAAVGLQVIASYFKFLKNLDGPVLIYPDLVLEMFSESNMLPWEVPPNLFKSWKSGTDCAPKDTYAANGMECSIFQNYGSDLIFLLCCAVFSIMIGAVNQYFKGKIGKQAEDWDHSAAGNKYPWKAAFKPPNSLRGKTYSTAEHSDVKSKDSLSQNKCLLFSLSIQNWFGWKFFFVSMQGNAMEILGYGVIHSLSQDDSLQFKVGLILSVLILVFYISYSWMFTSLVWEANSAKRKWRRRIKRLHLLNPGHQTGEFSLDKTLVTSFDDERTKIQDSNTAKACDQTIPPFLWSCLEQSRYGVLSFQLEEMKDDLKREWYYFLPVLTFLRYLILQLAAYTVSGDAFTQLSIVLGVESIFLPLTIYTRVNKSKIQNFLDCTTSILTWLYLVCKFVSLRKGLDSEFLQNRLGILMALILLSIVVLQLILMTAVSIITVFGFLKSWLTKAKVKPRVIVNPTVVKHPAYLIRGQAAFEDNSLPVQLEGMENTKENQVRNLSNSVFLDVPQQSRARFLSSFLESSFTSYNSQEVTRVTSDPLAVPVPNKPKSPGLPRLQARKFRIHQPNDPTRENPNRAFNPSN